MRPAPSIRVLPGAGERICAHTPSGSTTGCSLQVGVAGLVCVRTNIPADTAAIPTAGTVHSALALSLLWAERSKTEGGFRTTILLVDTDQPPIWGRFSKEATHLPFLVAKDLGVEVEADTTEVAVRSGPVVVVARATPIIPSLRPRMVPGWETVQPGLAMSCLRMRTLLLSLRCYPRSIPRSSSRQLRRLRPPRRLPCRRASFLRNCRR